MSVISLVLVTMDLEKLESGRNQVFFPPQLTFNVAINQGHLWEMPTDAGMQPD